MNKEKGMAMAESYRWPQNLNEPRKMSLVIDRNFTIVWADQPALRYFGMDIIGQPCRVLLGNGGEPCTRCLVRDCFEDSRSHVDQCEAQVRGGRHRFLRRTALPAEFRPDGSLQYVKEIIEDITAGKIFEKAMAAVDRRAPQKRGQSYLSALAVNICRSLKAYKVFIGAFDPEHTQVQTIAVTLHGALSANFSYPLFNDPSERLVDTPLIVVPTGAAREDPQCHWLTEGQISGWVGVQLKDGHGTAIGVMVALFQKDIKDIRLIEDLARLFAGPAAVALEEHINRQTLDKYRHIVATSNDQLALLDLDFVYQVVNRNYAAFHGLAAEKIVGQPMPAVIGADFFAGTIRPVAEECLQGRQGRMQVWQAAADRSRRCLDMVFYPHYEKGANRIKGFVLCIKDITRSKKLEANLRQASKMEAIGRLAGGIVHDFNNILGAVVGYTDLALSIVGEHPELVKYLEEIRQAGLRATELVKQILAFSRQNHEVRKPVQPKTILKEALRLLRATIPANIAIRTDLESDAFILADPIHLHQIIINLCTNAQHAMRDHGGILSVGLQDFDNGSTQAKKLRDMQPGPCIRMTFTDTGQGIPAHIQAKMFDPFFTTKAKGEGTGMGLTMVDSIVKSYQGTIDLQSETGRGTTIEIFLPAVEADQIQNGTDEIVLPQGEGQRILVVDDERKLVEVTAISLGHLGYNVHAETDSGSALELFKADPAAFDMILSDVAMPGMSGDALAKEILALRPDIPVVLMTGHSDRVDQNLIRQLGVKKLVSKPLSLNLLAVAVKEVFKSGIHSGSKHPF
jgi:PAS domain S-box-containing protein